MLAELVRWVAHVLGIDTQSSYFYAFYSGIGAKLVPSPAEAALVWLWYRRNQCHAQGCWLLGRHMHEGTGWCGWHHPNPHPSVHHHLRRRRRRPRWRRGRPGEGATLSGGRS